MKRRYLIGFGLALGLLVAAGAVLLLRQCGASGYDAQGRVAGFSDDPRTVIVEHEAIEGYMPAMTMPLTATDSTQLQGLEVGDAIGFRLNVNRDSAWITGVERLPDSAVAQHPTTPPPTAKSSEQPVLQEGDRVPDFTLSKSQSGQPVRLSDYEGDALVLTFIYTRCPLPDYCPLMSQNLAQLQDQMLPELQGDVQLLSVSFDPENDTPQVLRDYAQRYTDDLSNWTFATGTEKEVAHVTSLFGVFTRQEDGEITHNLRTVLIGPEGRVRQLWRGNDWQPEQVLEAMQRVVDEQEAAAARD